MELIRNDYDGFEFKTKPYAHQLDAFKKSCEQENWALFMEMGCGKSKVLIDNAAYLYQEGKIDAVIIIAPKGVYTNWTNKEIPIHLPDRIPAKLTTWRTNLTKATRKELTEGLENKEGLNILVANIEAFVSKNFNQYVQKYIAGRRFMLVVDESTTIKNPTAKRTKACIALGDSALYRRVLTGSPVVQSPLDLWSQCAFLDKKLLGFNSYYGYQARYAVTRKMSTSTHSFNKVVGYRNIEELHSKLGAFSSRVLKKDCLDLPDKVYTIREVEMTKEQQEHYNSLKEFAVTLLDNDEVVSTPAAMTQMLRLQQVLCGYLKTDDGELVAIKNNRLSALLETIEEISGKVIIWARFRKDIQDIVKALQKEYGEGSAGAYYGSTEPKVRELLIDRFQSPSEACRFFVGNPQTAGFGLTLTAASNVIYYSNDFNLENRVQSEDRCHRIGQKNKVTYIDLMTRNSIDQYIVKKLQSKIKIASKTLGEELKEWLEI